MAGLIIPLIIGLAYNGYRPLLVVAIITILLGSIGTIAYLQSNTLDSDREYYEIIEKLKR